MEKIKTKNDKKLTIAIGALILSVVLVVFGSTWKIITATGGSATGLGSPGDAMYNVEILYEQDPQLFPSAGPFYTPGIMGPYLGTVSGIDIFPQFPELSGVMYANFYYGYDWCKKYDGVDEHNCTEGRMPMCVNIWVPFAEGGLSDMSVKACYVLSDGDPDNKTWRENYTSGGGVAAGYAQVRKMEVMTGSVDYAGMAAVDN